MESLIKSIASRAGWTSSKRRAVCAKGAFSLSLLLLDLLLFGVSALLASFAPFEGISPFGVSCVLAAWYSGADPYFAAIGAAIGYAVSGSFSWAVCAFLLGAFIFAVDSKLNVQKLFRLLWGFAAECAMLLPLSPLFGDRLVLNIGSATVSVLGAVVIGCGFRALNKFACGRSLSDTELLTLAASLGLVTLSMRTFRVLGLSPAMVFAGVCALLSASRLGPSSVALAVTVAAGRVLATGLDMHFIAVLAALTLASASVRVFGKWACLALFFGLSLLFLKLVGGQGVFSLPESAVICALFAAVPEVKRSRHGATKQSPSAPSDYGKLQLRVASLSDVLSELARVMGGEEGGILSAVSVSLRRSLNKGSSRRERLTVDYGAAKSTKPGSAASGDSWSALKIDGRVLLALSDGMGTGEEAMNESRAALALLTDLASVGFELGEAARLVNGLLIRDGGETYATLDAVRIDLDDGSASLNKNGAPSSYLLRGGKVLPIRAEALPIGVIEGAVGSTGELKILPGDALVMMTDGVSDALDQGLRAAIRANVSPDGDPEESANALLKEAEKRGVRDDMTVLVVCVKAA